jgi:WD40 repeat protein
MEDVSMQVQLESQRSLLRPLAISVTATLGFSLLVGVLLLPREIEEERRPYLVAVDDWARNPQGQLAWVIGRGEPQSDRLPVRYQLYQVSNSDGLLRGEPVETKASPTCMVSAPEGPIVAFDDGQIRQFPLGAKPVDIGRHSSGHVLTAVISSDQQWLLTWGSSACVWDLSNRQRVGSFPRTFNAAALASRGDSFYCDRLDYIVECDARTGQEIREIAKTGRVFMIALSADERRLVIVGHDRSLQVVDTQSGELLWGKSLRGVESVTRLTIPFFSPVISLSPSGKTFAIVHEIGCHDSWGVSVWQVETGKMEHSFMAHQSRLICARFLSDHELVTSGLDCRFVRWSLTAGPPRSVEEFDTRDWRVRDSPLN